MNYEQKYNKLVNAIKVLQETNPSDEGIQNWVNDNVPELRESEDEKIKETLISFVKDKSEFYGGDWKIGDFTESQIVDWLEKQGTSYTKRCVDDAYLKGISDAKEELEKQNKQIFANSAKTCKDEQKPVDMIEPKFKVGDWVIRSIKNEKRIGIVTEILPEHYIINFDGWREQIPIIYGDCIDIRLWTIQDAKDGDVLVCNEEILLFKSYSVQGRISLYCWYNGQTNNFHSKDVTDALLTTRNKICPATKEQRDTLMKAMADAGYTFDFEKKELKRIEQNMELTDFESALFTAFSDAWQQYLRGEEVNVAQWAKEHSAELLEEARKEHIEWSEEDEEYINDLIGVFDGQQYQAHSDEEVVNWLKSIRLQYNKEWGKSDEEMLKSIIATCELACENRDSSPARHLLQMQTDWLKSLKQRIGGRSYGFNNGYWNNIRVLFHRRNS